MTFIFSWKEALPTKKKTNDSIVQIVICEVRFFAYAVWNKKIAKNPL